jgi:hypothetical protein
MSQVTLKSKRIIIAFRDLSSRSLFCTFGDEPQTRWVCESRPRIRCVAGPLTDDL